MPTLPPYAPIVILLLAALLCWGGGLLPGLRRWVGWVATLAVAAALLAYVAGDGTALVASWFTAPGGDAAPKLMADSLGQPFVLVTLILGGLALLGSSGGKALGDGFYPFALLLLAALLGFYLASGLLLAALAWSVAASAGWLLTVNAGVRGEAQGRAVGAGLAGLLLLGGVAYLGRLNGGRLDYAAIVPATVIATAPLALLLAGILVGTAQYPLLWAAGDEARPHWASRALVFGLGFGLPELYLALRVQQLAAAGNLSLPDWWFTTLAIVCGLTALLGAAFALRSATASDAFTALTVSGSGLTFWALGLHTAGATSAALLLAIGLASGRVTLATALGSEQRLTAIVGGLTLALLPPFGGFIGLWLLFNAALQQGNRLGLFLLAAVVLLTLPAAAALVAGARRVSTPLDEPPPTRKLPAVTPIVALIGLAGFSLALSLAAPLRDWLTPPALAPLVIGASQTDRFSIAATGGQWLALAVALALAVGLLLWLALIYRARAAVAPAPEAEGMAAPDVLAPLDLYLSPLRWVQPRTWAGWLAWAGGYAEGGLARLDHVLEGRYYLLVTALLLLVALLVISR